MKIDQILATALAGLLVVCGSIASLAESGPTPIEAQKVVLIPKVLDFGKWVEGITISGKHLWVAESGQRTVARMDVHTPGQIRRFKVGRLPVSMVSSGGGDIYALVATDKKIWRHKPNGILSSLARFSGCPEDMVSDGSVLWVITLPECSSLNSRLVRVDGASGKQKESGLLGEWATDLVAFENQVWISHARYPAFTVVDKTNMASSRVAFSDGGMLAITANTKHVFAGGIYNQSNDGVVVKIDPVTRTRLATAVVPQWVVQIIASDDHVIAAGNNGTLWVYGADDLKLQRTIHLSTGPFEPRGLVFQDDTLLVSSATHQGQNGAVFMLRDWLPADSRVATNGPISQSHGAIFTEMQAGSWGGRVRKGPGMDHAIVGSLKEGEPVTLIRKTEIVMNNFPWFEIRFRNGQTGYQWGGILCAKNAPIEGVFQNCN